MQSLRFSIRFAFVARASIQTLVGCGLVLSALLLLSVGLNAVCQTSVRPTTLAVLDFGDSSIGGLASEKLAANLKSETGISVLDRDQISAAARGAGYAGSINLSLNEARDLGAALGSDFFILGDAQTLRRSPSAGPAYFES